MHKALWKRHYIPLEANREPDQAHPHNNPTETKKGWHDPRTTLTPPFRIDVKGSGPW